MNISSFDREVVTYLRKWITSNGHLLTQLVLETVTLEPGHAVLLVVEGTPLINGFEGED